MKVFTLAELARNDGKEGRPAYFAYKGLVYDVSGSFLWNGGNHLGLHRAGCDLTGKLEEAPHGEEFLREFPTVGILEKS